MADTKFCKDCKHILRYLAPSETLGGVLVDTRLPNCAKTLTLDPVLGVELYQTCRDERKVSGVCGVEGTNWEIAEVPS
jgi:hypothetical protein